MMGAAVAFFGFIIGFIVLMMGVWVILTRGAPKEIDTWCRDCHGKLRWLKSTGRGPGKWDHQADGPIDHEPRVTTIKPSA